MKKLIYLLLLPFTMQAQEPIWTKCVFEKEYSIAVGDRDIKQKDGIKYCQNRYAFGFFTKDHSEVFEMQSYSQDTINGYLSESFYNKSGGASLEGDYFVTVTHSKPATILIQHTKGNSGYYYIKTNQIPCVKINKNQQQNNK